MMFLPQLLPMPTIVFARAAASFSFFINAPLPHFTSRTIFLSPAASFLLIMLAEIRALSSTVAVTSLSA